MAGNIILLDREAPQHGDQLKQESQHYADLTDKVSIQIGLPADHSVFICGHMSSAPWIQRLLAIPVHAWSRTGSTCLSHSVVNTRIL